MHPGREEAGAVAEFYRRPARGRALITDSFESLMTNQAVALTRLLNDRLRAAGDPLRLRSRWSYFGGRNAHPSSLGGEVRDRDIRYTGTVADALAAPYRGGVVDSQNYWQALSVAIETNLELIEPDRRPEPIRDDYRNAAVASGALQLGVRDAWSTDPSNLLQYHQALGSTQTLPRDPQPATSPMPETDAAIALTDRVAELTGTDGGRLRDQLVGLSGDEMFDALAHRLCQHSRLPGAIREFTRQQYADRTGSERESGIGGRTVPAGRAYRLTADGRPTPYENVPRNRDAAADLGAIKQSVKQVLQRRFHAVATAIGETSAELSTTATELGRSAADRAAGLIVLECGRHGGPHQPSEVFPDSLAAHQARREAVLGGLAEPRPGVRTGPAPPGAGPAAVQHRGGAGRGTDGGRQSGDDTGTRR